MRCPKCECDKPTDQFYKDCTRPNGYSSHCKVCKNEWSKKSNSRPERRQRENENRRRRNESPEYREKQRAIRKSYMAIPENRERARVLRNERYASDIQGARQKRIKFYSKHWGLKLLKSAQTASKQRQARGRNCPCTITLEHISALWEAQDGLCYFTGLPLQREMNRLDTVSIDRLDASRGYEPGNVVLAIKAMNFAKTGHSEEEFFVLLEQLRWALPFKLTDRRRLRAV